MGCTSSSSENPLSHATYANCKLYLPQIEEAKVVKVADGDTVTLAFLTHENTVCKFPARMYGYNSYDLHHEDEQKKATARKAKESLEARVLGKIVKVNVIQQREKYGRLLVVLSDSQGEINQWMLQNSLGIPYRGGKKIE
jgi:endonuclease YncB( thermonuclease family)